VSSGRPLTGGALLARTLRELGVEVAFGVHGGHLDSFLIACRDEGIELVDVRHEATGVHAADGYFRVSGRLGVCFATAGAGFANALAGLAPARVDRSALLLITSSPPRVEVDTNALQGGLDQVAWARPATKWAHQVAAAGEIPHLASVAVRTAMAAPNGPTVLDVPIDVVFGPVGADHVSHGGGAALPYPPAPHPRGVADALTLMRAAERPVIVSSGAVAREGRAELSEFAARAQIPVFQTGGNIGGVPADHPLNGWGARRLSALAADDLQPDVVVLLAARPGRFLGGRTGAVIPASAQVVHVDPDAAEIGRVLPFAVGITADVTETLRAFLADTGPWPDPSDWIAVATGLHRRPQPFESEPVEVGGRMHPYHAMRALMSALPPDVTIVMDGGETCGWGAHALHFARPHRLIGNGGYLGMLGMTPGLAIGAQVAEPSRRVVVITGDGAHGFHLQEWDTMARHGLPIITAVFNNASWLQSADGQRLIFGEEGLVISDLEDTAYEAVATGLGARGRRIDSVDEIAGAVDEAFDANAPFCLNLSVSDAVIEPGMAKLSRLGTGDSNPLIVPYYDAAPETR
jgi:acetolactate synthase-1/2/3 large subunit